MTSSNYHLVAFVLVAKNLEANVLTPSLMMFQNDEGLRLKYQVKTFTEHYMSRKTFLNKIKTSFQWKLNRNLHFYNSVVLARNYSSKIIFRNCSFSDFGIDNFQFLLVAAQDFQTLPFPQRQKMFSANFWKL